MTPGLESALTVLIYALISLTVITTMYVFTLFGRSNKPTKHVVEHTGMAEDNFWTNSAAREETRAAEENRKAAEANERAEKIRLERVRIEQAG